MGWFAITESSQIAPGDTLTGILAAQPYRLTRKVAGGWSFEGAVGAICEQNGFVFAWHHIQNEKPTWNLPTLPTEGFSTPVFHTLHADSHPQETYENSIDLAHFPVVHGYSNIRVLEPMKTWEHRMRARYEIARATPIPYLTRRMAAQFSVDLHGIGFAHNRISVPLLGLKVRMLALSTPTHAGKVVLRLGVSVAKQAKIPLPSPILQVVRHAIAKNIVHDFEQDLAVWNNKAYLRPPVLTAADGPIGDFRKWCQQFYEVSLCETTNQPQQAKL